MTAPDTVNVDEILNWYDGITEFLGHTLVDGMTTTVWGVVSDDLGITYHEPRTYDCWQMPPQSSDPDYQLSEDRLRLAQFDAGTPSQHELRELEGRLAKLLSSDVVVVERREFQRQRKLVEQLREGHKPVRDNPWSLINYVYCSCGRYGTVKPNASGETITGPVMFPCDEAKLLGITEESS